jgi:hypothetical protein
LKVAKGDKEEKKEGVSPVRQLTDRTKRLIYEKNKGLCVAKSQELRAWSQELCPLLPALCPLLSSILS